LTRYRPQPPWEFLLTASRNGLQSFELTRLSHAANLRKEIATLMDQWLEENSAASVARLLIDRPPTRPPNLRRSVSRQRGSQRSKPVPSDPPPRSSHLRASMTPAHQLANRATLTSQKYSVLYSLYMLWEA